MIIRALHLGCLLARPRLPLYIWGISISTLSSLADYNTLRWGVFGYDRNFMLCLLIIFLLLKLKRYSSVTMEPRHLSLFYYIEYSLLVLLCYGPSLVIRLVHLKVESPLYSCVLIGRLSVNEMLTSVAHSQLLYLISHFSSTRLQVLYTALIGLVYDYLFQHWLYVYNLSEQYLKVFIRRRYSKIKGDCSLFKPIQEIGSNPQIYLACMIGTCLLCNLVPLVIQLSKRKATASRKSNPDEQSPLLDEIDENEVILWGQLLNKNYSRHSPRSAIRNANIYALKGKTVALVGENGAGKTTLLNILHQNMFPDSGGLYHSKSKGELRTALLSNDSRPPSFCSLPHFSKIMKEYYRLSCESSSKFNELTEYLNSHASSEVMNTLKYALTMCPDVLLLDETLDTSTRGLITEFLNLKELRNQSQVATIVATHDLEWAVQHSDYICVLEKGRISSFTQTKKTAQFLNKQLSIMLLPGENKAILREALMKYEVSMKIEENPNSKIIKVKCPLNEQTLELVQDLEELKHQEKCDIFISKGDFLSLLNSTSSGSTAALSQNLVHSLLGSSGRQTWCSKCKALLGIQLALSIKYSAAIMLCSIYYFDTLTPTYQSKIEYRYSYIAKRYLEQTNILQLSIYCIQWIWYHYEMKVKSPSSQHVLSSFLVFSLCFMTYLASLSSSLLSDLLIQTLFYLFTLFHLSFWNAYFISFASRSRCSAFYFMFGFLLILLIKLDQRFYFMHLPSYAEFTKISPFVNLAFSSISYLLRLNLFIGQEHNYLEGLILLFVYIIILDLLLLLCCHRKKQRKSKQTHYGRILINRGSSYPAQNMEMMIQSANQCVLPSFTLLECLLFAATYKGIDQAYRQIDALLEFFNLSSKRHKRMREVSLGEQKKTMIAMDLIGAPSSLQFTDLFKNLDSLTQSRLETFLLRLEESQSKRLQIEVNSTYFSTQFTSQFHSANEKQQIRQTELTLYFKEGTTEKEKSEVVEYLIDSHETKVEQISSNLKKVHFEDNLRSISRLLGRVREVQSFTNERVVVSVLLKQSHPANKKI